ncbi:MAG: hypothetical protein GXP26_14180 [Planctomycetes bacterium]|nr:hypothetical protein [Planctomycetota bacterium]
MASPFHYFRKNQKLFLVLAAGTAMFVFVLADPLSSMLQQMSGVTPRQASNRTVAHWDNGSINEQELSELVRRRHFVSQFLHSLWMQGLQRIRDEGGTPLQPTVPNFILNENLPPGSVEIDVVTRKIFAELAEEDGVSISDKLVNHYLNEIGFRRISGAEIQQMLASNPGRMGARAAEEQLFSGLHEMLLGEYYVSSYGSAIRNVMPEQRWEDWLQINKRIALEAAILPTEQFLAETEEPSDEELKKFYDDNKDRVEGSFQLVASVQLPSPEAGFKEPRRVRIQYLQGDVTAWTEKLLDTVTDEEIADYYERNKRTQFVKAEDTSTATETETTEEESTSSASDSEEAAEETEETTEKTTEPAESADAEESSEAPAEKTEEAKPAAEESGDIPSRSPFRFAAFQEEGEGESVADTSEPAEDAAAEEEKPGDDSDESSTESPATPATSESTDESTSEEEEEPVEYEPLELVSDQIRRQLANDKAVVELQRVMELAYAELQSEFNSYGGKVITAQSQEQEPPAVPAKLADLSSMAKQHGLIYESTTALSARELSDTFVGKAVDTQTRSQWVVSAAFRSLQLHEPFLAQDIDGQWYLVTKTEDQPSSVPDFEEVRDKVAAAWKQNQAAKIALETAQKLSQEAEEAGGPLATFMANKGYTVVTTDLFSSRTFGTTQMEMRAGARLGEAPPLTAVGLDFMDKAFQLEPEQAVALQNHDHSNAYVVRLDHREKSNEELRQLFLREANSWFGARAMLESRWQHARQQLREQLQNRGGLDVEEFGEYLQELATR